MQFVFQPKKMLAPCQRAGHVRGLCLPLRPGSAQRSLYVWLCVQYHAPGAAA